jgi:hypothetical protein
MTAVRMTDHTLAPALDAQAHVKQLLALSFSPNGYTVATGVCILESLLEASSRPTDPLVPAPSAAATTTTTTALFKTCRQ